MLRLLTTATGLVAGFLLHRAGLVQAPGVVLGVFAVIMGVLAEATYIGLRTRTVVAEFFDSDEEGIAPTSAEFMRFYVPLAMTSLLALVNQPVGSAAISRMPAALASLAAWPVVIGLTFVLRSGGTAYKEVVVAMLDRPDPLPALHRFNGLLAGATLLVTCLFAFTPLSMFWFERVSGLEPALADLARRSLWLAVLLPVGGVLQNWYVGYLVHARRTRRITESMVAFLAVSIGVLAAGVIHGGFPGLWVAFAAFTLGNMAQLAWAWRCARPGLKALAAQRARIAA